MDDKEYYEAYAKEIYALYESFRDAGFDQDQSFELVKICIKNLSIDNSFYTRLEMKRNSDRLKASLNHLKSFEEKEKNHAKF